MRNVTGKEFERLGCAHSSGLWGQRKSANGFQFLTGHHQRQLREVSLESSKPFESLKGIPVSSNPGIGYGFGPNVLSHFPWILSHGCWGLCLLNGLRGIPEPFSPLAGL